MKVVATYERYGFIRISDMVYSMIQDLIASGGFTLKFPATLPPLTSGLAPNAQVYTLEATSIVDPLIPASPAPSGMAPLRIMFNILGDQKGWAQVATKIQLPDDGTSATWPLSTAPGNQKPPEPIGCIGSERDFGSPGNTYPETRQYRFLDRSGGTRAIGSVATAQSAPMSYRITVTDHGVAIMWWEPGTDSYVVGESSFANGGNASASTSDLGGAYNSWLVIQRPVDKTTGAPLIAGKAPLLCVYKLFQSVYQFTVSETDVPVPTMARPADSDVEDSRGIINSQSQVSINEAEQYVITFPGRFNTRRYAYTQELDLLAVTSSDVVGEGTDVPTTVYGEATQRVYHAMQANQPNNTGMRVLLLTAIAGS